jgi:hypothetical protein
MMGLQEALLASMLQWAPTWYPPGHNPETPEQYRERLVMISEVIADEASLAAAGKPVWEFSNGETVSWTLGAQALAAAALTVWYGETKFSFDLHVHGKSRWGQDRGKAHCMGQLHVSKLVPKPEWESTVGATRAATRNCARATMRVLAVHVQRCGVDGPTADAFARVFFAYGSGQGCGRNLQSVNRGRRFVHLLSKL